VAYFSVVLSRTEDGWETNDIELDEVESLADLADAMRETSGNYETEGPCLLLLEQEDMWFAVVRVDGDDDPRIFVSDRSAIEHSAYAEMLLDGVTAGDERAAAVDSEVEAQEEDEPEKAELDDGPVGDFDILADQGTDAAALVGLCSGDGVLPSEALTLLAERAGAAGALETVR
jgi:putative tRNA adenosine deaminase-associated protein